jgi:hypothetical protein
MPFRCCGKLALKYVKENTWPLSCMSQNDCENVLVTRQTEELVSGVSCSVYSSAVICTLVSNSSSDKPYSEH